MQYPARRLRLRPGEDQSARCGSVQQRIDLTAADCVIEPVDAFPPWRCPLPRQRPKFDFKGKSGRVWKLNVRDGRIGKVIRACQDLPGQELFQHVDDDSEIRDLTSSEVNGNLRVISGQYQSMDWDQRH